MRLDLGFRSDHVLTMQIFPRVEAGAAQSSQNLSPAFDDLVKRLERIPGIANASAASPGIPLRVNMWVNGLSVPGRPPEDDPSVSTKVVTSAYHQALAIPLRSGRLFDDGDKDGSTNVIILSDAAARAFFHGESPVGKTVALNRVDHTVVGVVTDVRQASLEANPHPEVYLPMAQSPTRSGYLVIRTHGDPNNVLPDVRAAVAGVLPDEPLRYVAAMDDLVAKQTSTRRLMMTMLVLFGVLGLVITAAGIFGVMAFLVAQRTREIGVRMALGATRGRVIGMIFRHSGGLVAAGTALGGVGAWYLAAASRRFLFGLDAHDIRAFIVPGAVVLIAAFVASLLPAIRAASVDPTVALRCE
jgi:putative ABC transport system permease protein